MTRAEIHAAIARHADTELLYDRPYEDRSIVRVAGPFTVESLSPHRVVPTDPRASPRQHRHRWRRAGATSRPSSTTCARRASTTGSKASVQYRSSLVAREVQVEEMACGRYDVHPPWPTQLIAAPLVTAANPGARSDEGGHT